ncbi:ABC transporter permease [Agrococcus baldri]|uniref:ABC transporter permease n=1 Tax=Agrococcus baldri TaxID=153730 RepID=A0AA87RGY6_9MICO|nr:iron ABC transporter permease [Agrococcus baldri]GEK80276.1 ABC transporter permease [Agrococcus baldri]
MPRSLTAALRRPATLPALIALAALAVLVAGPLAGLVAATLDADGLEAWGDVLASPLSNALLWEPLGGSLVVGLGTGIASVVLGSFLAWAVVLTDMPFRRTVGVLATIPFAIPSFAIALAWESVFRNDRIGGASGLLAGLGVEVPDALAWGALPVTLTLTAHYFSLAFVVVAAALASVGGDLLAAAELTGASRARVALRIALPAVAPAMGSGFLLAFAEGVSNFAVPALLGLPVRFQTLSTRLYGAISTGDQDRGFVLSILLVLVAALVLWTGTRLTSRSVSTVTGKPSRARRIRLGPAKPVVLAGALAIVVAATILPAIVLAASTVLRRTNRFDGGTTWHYWVGESDASIAQGLRGVLVDPRILEAVGGTVLLAATVAVITMALGFLAAWSAARTPPWIGGTLSGLSYVPFLIPGVALGAAVIAQFGRPFLGLPSIYGTFWILVVGGIAASIPFAFQTSRAALAQVSRELEDAAAMAGAGTWRTLGRILLPVTARGTVGGAALVFVTMARDLSLVVMLVTPATPLLAVTAYEYASEGFTQHANAITLIITVVSVTVTLLARRLEGRRSPWMDA